MKGVAIAGAAYWLGPNLMFGGKAMAAPIAGGTLAPGDVDKYASPLVKPPAFQRDGKINMKGGKPADYYEIGMRQFDQQILPPGNPVTTVWSYGPANAPTTTLADGFFYPAFTVENKYNKPAVVKWVNQLVDADGNYLPHLLPVDQTLHWANPPGGPDDRDKRGNNPTAYTGPVPMITHLHGGHTEEDSDGYPEAWYLPAAGNIPDGYATTGTFFDHFNAKYGNEWEPGSATFTYKNDQSATTLWFHDHALGMTRQNVYAGPAGFWLIRGGPEDVVLDSRDGSPANLPFPRPGPGDPFGVYYEIPIVIQDRSFNADGSLFYPDNRAFFEGLDNPAQLQIPFIPNVACDGLPSDVPPIWNPEFFGNMMVVNGQTWPYLEVEQRRYRFRFLNGCNSRFLVLKMTTAPRADNLDFNSPEQSFWQIGADQGFLPAPVELDHLLMAPAERADVIVDFANFPVGTELYLVNDGPDAPFGGISLEDLSDWESTGLVMKFVVTAPSSMDITTPPQYLELPPQTVLPPTDVTRQVSLNEEESKTVNVTTDVDGNVVLDCAGEPFAPTAALLGTLNPDALGDPMLWAAPITENPVLGATEEWEIHNFTEDAHPIHVHLVKFKVLGRGVDGMQAPEPWEGGFKDTVIAYPGEITRVKMQFDLAGYYVWHCHILEHEDNEMMRPYFVGGTPDGPQQ